MQTFPSSETVLLASNSPPLLPNPGGGNDVDIDFRDVFGGPLKRRSKVNELTRHSFSDTALRRLDVNVDNSSLVPRDDLWNERDEKPVFGEDTSVRRRFTADDFFDDIFGANESSLPGSRIRSPAQPIPHKAESPAKQVKSTEIPTFGLATRSLSKSNETPPSSPLSRTSYMGSAAKSGSDGYVAPQVVTGKGRQFHFSIYKWTNKGAPVVIWGSSRLSSMAKAEETTPGDLRSTTFEKAGRDKEGESGLSGLTEEKKTFPKPPGVQKEEEKTEIASTLKQTFSGDVLKTHEASVKPRHSCLDDKVEKQAEDIVIEGEVRKDKSKAKNVRISAGDPKKAQGTRSSLPDEASFASTSPAPEVGKDGVKGKVMDFVKIFSQGAGDESLGQSTRWRVKEHPVTGIKKDGANTEETVHIPDEQKKSIPDIPAMDLDPKPSQATKKKVLDRVSVNSNKPSGVTEQEARHEPSTAHSTSEDIDETIHVNFLVEDITQDEKKLEQTKNNAEEIQNINAKIRKWSSGKCGNIRSLLSMLHYILWPGSGWKAVPLMDLIEANAVRKSYQRALLILHPDKLQQKGASDNQKYTAGKVF